MKYGYFDESKKEYVITPLGKQIVEMEVVRLKELYDNGRQFIEAKGEM